MLKSLLTLCTAAIAFTAGAVTPDIQVVKPKVTASKVVERQRTVTPLSGKTGAHRIGMTAEGAYRLKTIIGAPRTAGSNVVNPIVHQRRSIAKAAGLPNGCLLYESFENADIDNPTWTPEGWTRLSNGEDGNNNEATWEPIDQTGANQVGIPLSDGDYGMFISYGYDQDEWLITPTVTLPEGSAYNFSFDLWVDPVWFFDTSKIDWETGAISEYVIITDYQAMIKVGDGEWQLLHSIAADWIGKDYYELATSASDATGKLWPYKLSLAEYAGQQVQLAVRYVGNDGNSTLLDNVRVALPSMDGVKMQVPFSTQYFGLSEDWSGLTMGIANYPVFEPITFENYSDEMSFSYSWLYSDPETAEYVSTDDETLEVTYHTDYQSEFTTLHNLYYPPVLCASGEGYSDAQVAMPVEYIQAGGANTWNKYDADYNIVLGKFGMMPFDQVYSELDYVAAEADFGERATPIFGHDKNTTAYWTDYTFQGDAEEGDYAAMNAIMNYIYPSSAPLVVNGAWISAYGQVEDGATLTCELFNLEPYYEDGEFRGYTIAETPLRSATCATENFFGRIDNENSYLSASFAFDNPLVIDDTYPAYIIKISGFNDDKFTYFCPIQQSKPNEDGICLGWVEKVISYQGVARTSLTPLANYENQYGEMMAAFAINLDSYYPWMQCTADEVTIDSSKAVEIPLDMFHDAVDVAVDAPEWVEATLTGRYGDAVLSIKAVGSTESDTEGVITLSAPGVKKEINVKQLTSGIETVTAVSDAPVKAIHTLTGQQVSASSLNPGVYVVTRTDGTASKLVVK